MMFLIALLVTVAIIVGVLGGAVFFSERNRTMIAPSKQVPPADTKPAGEKTGSTKDHWGLSWKQIAKGVMILAILLVTLFMFQRFDLVQLTSNGFVPNFLTQPAFWVVLLIGLGIAAMVLPKGRAIAGGMFLTLGLCLVYVAFAPFLNRGVESSQRILNDGDWSEPAGFVRTVSNGTVKLTYESDRFFVVGAAEVWHPYASSCISISPPGVFHLIPRDEYGYRYRIEPKHGQKALAIARVKPASECDGSSSS